ncbi:hypothetical protein [Tardiphaga robiniae]|uniref:Uncharacterized protein n=1 Tax=Tardiphaga robiniae TaxID=943830 RepID=A0A7G6U2C2_9BRAD|nr:hypothetical protein [Tardiphaga robiniae]QND73154.1 hypothetical protein HB776_19540 [Tardiphaga robiniae]
MDNEDAWSKEQLEPLSLFDLANKWSEAVKVLGAGNGAGLVAAGAALSAFAKYPTMLPVIKASGCLFFAGTLTFAVSFALIQLSIFSYDEMLHAIRKNSRTLAKENSKRSSSSMESANRFAILSAFCFFLALLIGIVAFLMMPGEVVAVSRPNP